MKKRSGEKQPRLFLTRGWASWQQRNAAPLQAILVALALQVGGILVTGCAASERGNNITLFQAESPEGDLLTYAVSEERMEATPSWTGKGEPPLSVAAALRVSATHLEAANPNRKSFRPHYITLNLSEIMGKDRSYYWYYAIVYEPETYLTRVASDVNERYAVVVLLDGTVVDPRSQRE